MITTKAQGYTRGGNGVSLADIVRVKIEWRGPDVPDRGKGMLGEITKVHTGSSHPYFVDFVLTHGWFSGDQLEVVVID